MTEKMEVANVLAEMVADKLGVGHDQVEAGEHLRNNGCTIIGLTARLGDKVMYVAPVINMDKILDSVMNGDTSYVVAAGNIAEQVRNGYKMAPDNINLDREYILGNCKPRVISAEKNRQLLENVPHRDVCDLAEIVYFPAVGVDGGVITANDTVLQYSGIEADELFEAAHRNARGDYELLDMKSVLSFLVPVDLDDGPGMYIVTTRKKLYGAAAIADTELLAAYMKDIGDCTIIPSSVHEIILLPKTEGCGGDDLREIVRNVNLSIVDEQEVLSDNVYELGADGKLHIA